MTIMLAAALVMNPAITVESRIPTDQVGFEELRQGQNAAAVKVIDARLAREPRDPAALINLAAANVRLGRVDIARASLHQAMQSPERYDLELADGRWLDSRAAARMGLAMLKTRTALALK